MGGSLTEAQKRLPQLANLEQAAALLNIPGLDDADRNTGAPLYLRQAALLEMIANWAGLSARAVRETGNLDFSGITEPYAYIIETVDEHQRDWWPAELGDGSGGIEESHDSPETFAVAVMNRYLDHMRDHLDVYEDTLMGELHVRVSVWPVHSVTAAHPSTAWDPDSCPPARYGHLLKRARISPRAVEIRTPLQVDNYVRGGGVTV
jgi:hypothetical protein